MPNSPELSENTASSPKPKATVFTVKRLLRERRLKTEAANAERESGKPATVPTENAQTGKQDGAGNQPRDAQISSAALVAMAAEAFRQGGDA